MQLKWSDFQRNLNAIASIPPLLGIVVAVLTGCAPLLAIGAVWFLTVIATASAGETFLSIRRKWPRRKHDAITALLQWGGYSLAAASMAAYFAIAFWTPYRPRWPMFMMFAGILMMFSSGIVHLARPQSKTAKHAKNPET